MTLADIDLWRFNMRKYLEEDGMTQDDLANIMNTTTSKRMVEI